MTGLTLPKEIWNYVVSIAKQSTTEAVPLEILIKKSFSKSLYEVLFCIIIVMINYGTPPVHARTTRTWPVLPSFVYNNIISYLLDIIDQHNIQIWRHNLVSFAISTSIQKPFVKRIWKLYSFHLEPVRYFNTFYYISLKLNDNELRVLNNENCKSNTRLYLRVWMVEGVKNTRNLISFLF